MGNPHVVIMSQTHAAIMTQAAREINFDLPVLTVEGKTSKYDKELANVAIQAQNLNNAGGVEK